MQEIVRSILYVLYVDKKFEKEKKFIINNLENLDCKIYPSVTNFLLIKIPFDSTYFTEKLLEKGIFVRDCKNFRNLGNNYIRIGIRSHKDNEKFIDKFTEMFKELKNRKNDLFMSKV